MFGYSINSKSKRALLKDLVGQGLSLKVARKIWRSSKSQVGQDLLALLSNGSRRDGFSVEFGSGDGIGLSNTYVPGQEFGWTGVLCEPVKNWHSALLKNRSCQIDLRCFNRRPVNLLTSRRTT